jgi:hypothetical protein
LQWPSRGQVRNDHPRSARIRRGDTQRSAKKRRNDRRRRNAGGDDQHRKARAERRATEQAANVAMKESAHGWMTGCPVLLNDNGRSNERR